jgi:hypothetical protein
MITKVLFLLCISILLGTINCQQFCLSQECKGELTACNADCVALMGKCTFTCTLSSLGCMQKCLGDNKAAQNLLECSFNKCINL